MNDLANWIPTTTAHQARLQLFQPTRRPVDLDRVIQTSWGVATISGKIGQAHADLVEAICKNAQAWAKESDGGLSVRVDIQTIRSSMDRGTHDGRYPAKALWALVKDLRKTALTLEPTGLGEKFMGGIIDSAHESRTKVTARNGQERTLWVIKFSAAFAGLLEKDLAFNYDPAPLAELKTGVAQAIARLVLTHREQPNGGWKLDTLLVAVGAVSDGENDSARRNRRRDIEADKEGLQKLGIYVEGGRITRGV